MKNQKIISTLDGSGQQGDVNMRVVSAIPADAKKRSSKVVRHGEATGHAHEIIGDAEMFELGDRVFARILEGDGATLMHEEHDAWKLPAGTIVEFGPTHEYDYDAEESRFVAD